MKHSSHNIFSDGELVNKPSYIIFLLLPAGESVPVDEQFDKEKAKEEVQALESAHHNDKTPPKPAPSSLPGVKLTDAEKEKYEAEMAKLYKELDDKVTKKQLWCWLNLLHAPLVAFLLKLKACLQVC